MRAKVLNIYGLDLVAYVERIRYAGSIEQLQEPGGGLAALALALAGSDIDESRKDLLSYVQVVYVAELPVYLWPSFCGGVRCAYPGYIGFASKVDTIVRSIAKELDNREDIDPKQAVKAITFLLQKEREAIEAVHRHLADCANPELAFYAIQDYYKVMDLGYRVEEAYTLLPQCLSLPVLVISNLKKYINRMARFGLMRQYSGIYAKLNKQLWEHFDVPISTFTLLSKPERWLDLRVEHAIHDFVDEASFWSKLSETDLSITVGYVNARRDIPLEIKKTLMEVMEEHGKQAK